MLLRWRRGKREREESRVIRAIQSHNELLLNYLSYRAGGLKKSCPMGTGRSENPAFIYRAVGLTNPATKWQNPTLDFKAGNRRGSRKEGI